MSREWDNDPEAQAWIADVEDNMVPRMEASGAVVSIQTGKADVKLAVELGMALLLDKPLILAVTPGSKVPERLARAADDIIEFDMSQPEATAQRVSEAMDRILPPLDPKPWLHEQSPRKGTDGKEFIPEPERRADGGLDNALWAPRPGYAQNMEDYGQ